MGDSPWTLRMTVFLWVDLQGTYLQHHRNSHIALVDLGAEEAAVTSNLYQYEESAAGHSAFFNNYHNSLLSSIFVVFQEGEKY